MLTMGHDLMTAEFHLTCDHDPRRRRAAELRRGVQGLAQDRLPVVRRAGRPDRHDASRRGRREEMDRRAAVPARAELLRAVAGAGGAEARDLYRLAAARRARRACGRHPVRAAGRVRDAGAEPALRARARHPDRRRRAVRHQGGRAGDRDRGAHSHRQARAQDLAAARHRGGGLRRHLLHGDAVSADRRSRPRSSASWSRDRRRRCSDSRTMSARWRPRRRAAGGRR